jgi:hypothetical protein
MEDHMLNQAGKNIFSVMQELPLSAGVSEVFEGMALVADNTGTEVYAKPSTGAKGEQFLGVALINALKVVDLPIVESLIAVLQPPAGPNTQVTLSRSPTGAPPELTGYVGTPATVVTFTLISGTTYQTDLAGPIPVPAGTTVVCSYTYKPTLAEVLAVFHQSAINFENVNALLSQISVGGGVNSEFQTMQYINTPGVNYTLGGPVYLGPNGKFSADPGSAPATMVGICTKLPTPSTTPLALSDDRYLGVKVTDGMGP